MPDAPTEPMTCICGHTLEVHGPSPRTGKLVCFGCDCNDYQYVIEKIEEN